MKYAAPPTAPTANRDFATFVRVELQRIADAIASFEADSPVLKEWNEAPARPFDGLVIFADGTNFNPGQGQSFYGYYDGAWHQLSGANFEPGALTLIGAEAVLFEQGPGPTWDSDGEPWDNDATSWDSTGETLSADPGALQLTGADATLLAAGSLAADPGALQLTGGVATLTSTAWDDDSDSWNSDSSAWD